MLPPLASGGIGPMHLPWPLGMTEAAVREAQRAHDAPLGGDDPLASPEQKGLCRGIQWGWVAVDDPAAAEAETGDKRKTYAKKRSVVAWLTFAVQCAHHSKAVKTALLRTVARGFSSHVGDDNKSVFDAIKAKAKAMGPTVAPGLDAYFEQHKLGSLLAPIQVAKKGAEGGGGGGMPLHQGVLGGNALFSTDPGIKRAVDEATRSHRTILIAMLAIMARAFTAAFTDDVQSGLGSAPREVRGVDSKTFGRMFTKHADEHEPVLEEHGLQLASLNLDPMRVGIQSDTPEDELKVWERVRTKFEPLRAKNLFCGDSDAVGESGLRFILINVLWKPQVTFGEWIGSPEYEAALEGCKEAEPDWDVFDSADTAFRNRSLLSAIGKKDIAMVCEVQLVLSVYLEARKKTHLWFKIERAPGWVQLNLDCGAKYSGYSYGGPGVQNRSTPTGCCPV